MGRSLLLNGASRLSCFLCDALDVFEDADGDLVTALDFSRSGITAVRTRLLAGILRSKHCTLTSLDLVRQLELDGVKLLARALEVNTTLARLNLDGVDLHLPELRGTTAASAPPPPVAERPSDRAARSSSESNEPPTPTDEPPPPPVHALDYSYRSIGDASGLIVAKLLEANAELTSLELQFNIRLGKETGRALATALLANCTLTRLDVRGRNARSRTPPHPRSQ